MKKRTVTRRAGHFLRLEEVPRLFDAMANRWRPPYATALYTGLRKGELELLRHRAPRVTMEVYGHLSPDYLRAKVDSLSLGPGLIGAVRSAFAAPVLHALNGAIEGAGAAGESCPGIPAP